MLKIEEIYEYLPGIYTNQNYFRIGPGWLPIVQQLLHDFSKTANDFKTSIVISELYEWDGSIRMRYSIENPDKEIEKRIRTHLQNYLVEVDDEIYMHCSICGSRRTTTERLSSYYTETVCSSCREKM